MIASKRYLNKNWLLGQLIHSVCGDFITLVTLVWAFKVLALLNWKIEKIYPHTVFSLALLVLVCIVTLSGMIGALFGRFYKTKSWSHEKEIQNKISKFHKIAGWGCVILGFITTSTGLLYMKSSIMLEIEIPIWDWLLLI